MNALLTRYVEAILRGARSEAIQLIADENDLGVSQRMALIADAQREIGRLWEQNRISIADEHLATAISHLALARLFDRARPAAPNGKRVLVACVEGELHDFPARLAADALELAGFRVLFLGANVPIDSLIHMIEQKRPDLIALSIAMTFNLPSLRRAVERIRVAAPSVPVLVGGQAGSWIDDLARQVGADGSGPDALALLDTANRLLRVAA